METIIFLISLGMLLAVTCIGIGVVLGGIIYKREFKGDSDTSVHVPGRSRNRSSNN